MTEEIMETMQTTGPGTFAFSAARPEDLPEEEYTLVVIMDDVSPSTEDYRNESCEAKKAIIKACRKSPRAEKLLIRQCVFGTSIKEVHGFKSLQSIDEQSFVAEPTIGHSTALFDSAYDAVSSVLDYAKTLDTNADILSNGIVFDITDGMDNASSMTARSVAEKIRLSKKDEWPIESIKVVLVGLFDPKDSYASTVKEYLEEFKNDAEIDQYIDVGDATPQKLAKLAEFVSQSISSQSQSLGTGGPSQNLAF